MAIEFKILKSDELHLLLRVAPEVFDYKVDARLSEEFLNDSRHHLAVAVEDGVVIGFASAVNYIHPDKVVELYINELGVAPTHRNRGVAKKMLKLLFEVGRDLGCSCAWVLTERSNTPAMRLYQSCGGTEATEETVMFSFELKQ